MKTVIVIFLVSVASLFSQVTIPTHFPNRCIVTNTSSVLPHTSQIAINEPLKKEVMGWHPYWAGANAHTSYDYTVLNHLSYFGYELESDGSLKTYNSTVSDSAVIAYAKEQGCRTSVTIICFDASIFSAVMDDEDKYTLFQTEVIELVERLEVDEVIFDFEPLSAFPQEKIRDFSLDMKFALFVVPSVELISISIAMPAVDWNNSINLENYSFDFDKLIVMAYDYYWQNSPIAGPVSPLKSENKNVQNTISTYLESVPKEQLIIAFPWYGYDWPVNSTQRKASTTGGGTARTLAEMVTYTTQNNPTFDTATQVPWLNYTNAQIQRQIWFEDSISLTKKYFEITKNDLAGVGIWALNYANGLEYVWNEIRTQFERTIAAISANVELLEFNSIQIQSTSIQTVTLTNIGNSELLISAINIVGNDESAYSITQGNPGSTPISIAPNGSTTFTVQFAPTEVKAYNNASIVIFSNAAENLIIPLQGVGSSSTTVTANVQSIEFKGVQIQTTSSQSIRLKNTGNSELQISAITITGTDASVYSITEGNPGTTPIVVVPNDSTTFTVQFAPIDVKSYNNASIAIVSNASNNLIIPVSGEGQPITSIRGVSIEDNDVTLKHIGKHPISSESALEITVGTNVNCELRVRIIDASGANVYNLGAFPMGVGTTIIPFSVENLASGAYTIVATNGGKQYTLPLRIVR